MTFTKMFFKIWIDLIISSIVTLAVPELVHNTTSKFYMYFSLLFLSYSLRLGFYCFPNTLAINCMIVDQNSFQQLKNNLQIMKSFLVYFVVNFDTNVGMLFQSIMQQKQKSLCTFCNSKLLFEYSYIFTTLN